MEQILQSYLRRLTNLSGNNRSLLLLRLISDQFLDLHDLDFATDKSSFNILEALIGRQNKVPVCQEMDSRDDNVNLLSRRLKRIKRIDNFIFEERGAKDLYVGWPFVRGKFSDGTLVRCPLIFFPVTLELSNGTWYLIRRSDVNITLNKSFLLAYAYYNEVQLDEELVEMVIDDYDRDSVKFRTELYELLKNSQVEINFNRENFEDRIASFIDFRKSDLEASENPGELKLYPEAAMGIFPQAGSYLVPDYLHMIEKGDKAEMSDFFSQAIPATEVSSKNRIKEESTFTPFRMDAYQESALAKIKQGQSLVVQGPPGSGKSQLISNMISDFIARGKNVLLVCQKRAALDVVWERLKAKGLHDFIGLVHDFKNDRKSIFQQIAGQVDALEDYQVENNSLDAIQLERQFQQASRKIDLLTEELDEFKDALYDDSESGKSVKELYLISDIEAPSVSFNQEYRDLNYAQLDDFERKLDAYLDYYDRFETDTHFWASGKSFADLSVQDLTKIKAILDEIPGLQHKITKDAREFTKQTMDYETVLFFASRRDRFDELIELLSDEKSFERFKLLIARKPENPQETINRLEQGVMSCFKGVGPEITLPFKDLGRFQEALEAALKARRNPFSWLKWKLTSADKVFISRVLVANELKSNEEGFEVLLARIDNRLNFEHFHSEIQESDWMEDFPKIIRKIDVQAWFFAMKEAVKAYLVRNEVRSLPEYISATEYELHTYLDRLKSLTKLLDEVPEITRPWKEYLTDAQIRLLMMDKKSVEEVKLDLNRDFDALVEYHKIDQSFNSSEKSVVDKGVENYESKEQSIALFRNSLALAWIDHIEAKYPVLRSVSSQRLEQITKELRELIQQKRQISQDILLLKSRERTYSELEYNRLNNRVTYRDLYHQVTKKRQIWPIRRVISEYHDELFQLLPCWMTSPESASAIFPMDQVFDLVIFDEASQCFAERGLPAMYRGDQVVIAGDDKQLKPNDLYRVRWDEVSEQDIPEVEIDSLLDLAKNHIPQVSLQGHYRSQTLPLISFSNEHFYGGKLKMLPHFDVMNDPTPPIRYEKVEGIWEDNRNQEEANKVADIVMRLIKDQPDKTIGIVTFNAKQQDLVLDVLEAETLRRGILLPEHLFVKNIENVQGDERDVIIFTMAYAPDKKGVLRMQFGSLNQEGGENRLNVAVTRAREAIYIVCSIHPDQMHVDNTRNAGPKLLKQYLTHAYRVHSGEWSPEPYTDQSYQPTWYLRKRLETLPMPTGVKLEKNLPFADLSVMYRGQYTGVILSDDDLFFSNLSAKQSHAYQHFHFTEKKWPHTRYFSRDFWMDRKSFISRLEKFIERVID